MSERPVEDRAVSVVIVDDHKLFAEAVKSALEHLGMMVAGVATTAEDADRVIQTTRPNIVLLDIGLPDADGLTFASRMMARHPRLKVVVVSENGSSKQVQEALRRGIHGYLTKDASMSQLADSIQAAMRGRLLISQRLARAAAGSSARNDRNLLLLSDQLTDREMEVLRLLADGATSAQIADRLGLSRNTVRTHVQAILTKLQVHSRLEAVAFAVRHRLVALSRRRS